MVNRLGGLRLPRKSVVRLTDHPDMTLDVYRGRKTTMQQQQQHISLTNGWNLTKLAQKHHKYGVKKWLDFGDLDLIY